MTDSVMLTTLDNPYNPFKDWDRWFEYDTAAGYHTNAFLARVANSSEELSEADQDLAYEQAIDEILKENASGIYRAVYPDTVVVPVKLPTEEVSG